MLQLKSGSPIQLQRPLFHATKCSLSAPNHLYIKLHDTKLVLNEQSWMIQLIAQSIIVTKWPILPWTTRSPKF